ncbi:hypothetical protein [Streptomyces sp. RTd22]|uniref:hypothetical protein n=1 Tax=Streptomyces sp. RTd22 TaxID=1841249 RepID=UPI0007C590C1|nr:hypothetical protein [Streptomyces sp. RTd22]
MTPQVCARYDKPTSTPVVVAIEHGASAGGGTVYACPGKCADSIPRQRDPFDHGTLPARHEPVRHTP